MPLPTQARSQGPLLRQIVVHVNVGSELMAGTDDPVFLRLGGPAGREFRLKRAKGRSFHRGEPMDLVLGDPKARDTNVAHPELNDPSSPGIPLEAVTSVALVKGLEPIPNVRGVGELDDRLLIELAKVTLHAEGEAAPVVFRREGPIWLGLVSGLFVELARAEAP